MGGNPGHRDQRLNTNSTASTWDYQRIVSGLVHEVLEFFYALLLYDACAFTYTVFILIEHKQKNNSKSGLHTIRVKTIPGSEFSSIN